LITNLIERLEMKIRYFSDLHTEFMNWEGGIEPYLYKRICEPMSDDICVCAGDMGNPFGYNYHVLMKHLSRSFKKTFVIPGNHEYYQKDKTIEEVNGYLEAYFHQYHNISFLNNRCERYQSYLFIGTVLWSKVMDPTHYINDTSKIPALTVSLYNEMNVACVKFLEETMNNEQSDKCIIITHHMPSKQLIHEKYNTPDMEPYQQWFYCEMNDFINTHKDKIKAWIYGHTHTPSEAIIHGVPCVCNPIGYPKENKNPDFYKQIIIQEQITGTDESEKGQNKSGSELGAK